MTIKKLLEAGGLIGDTTDIFVFEITDSPWNTQLIAKGKWFEDHILVLSDRDIINLGWTPKELIIYLWKEKNTESE